MTLEQLGPRNWNGRFPADWGISAHTKPDPHTGEMLVFNYAKTAPYMHYGVVDAHHELVHWVDVPLPGPRLPHDMAFTEHYAILNDCPLFWDAELLAKGAHVPRFRPDLPTRFAVIPRRGDDGRHPLVRSRPDLRPALGERLRGRRRDRARRLLPGRPACRSRDGETDLYRRAFRGIDTHRMQTVLKRWRMNLTTGACTEETAVGADHGVPDDQPAARGPAVSLHVQHDDAARMVPVRRHRQGRPRDRVRRSATRSATACSAARRRWRPARARPPRTTATS